MKQLHNQFPEVIRLFLLGVSVLGLIYTFCCEIVIPQQFRFVLNLEPLLVASTHAQALHSRETMS